MKIEIKAEELMIGNYILFAGLINQVSVISKERIQFETGGGNIFNLRDCYGIALTPEILEKCGLIDGVFPDIEYFSIAGLNSMPESYGLYYENDWTSVSIEYLHQLQNLYFALTGTHLTIEL